MFSPGLKGDCIVGQKVTATLDRVEDNRVDRSGERGSVVDNKVDRLPSKALAMAKATVGAAVEAAIGDQLLKRYGDEGMVSKIITGEKVPAYLAQIARDPEARQRFALALLKGTKVRRRIVLDWDDERLDD